MSDFFTTLVERAQATVPAIAPRRAGRFESAADADLGMPEPRDLAASPPLPLAPAEAVRSDHAAAPLPPRATVPSHGEVTRSEDRAPRPERPVESREREPVPAEFPPPPPLASVAVTHVHPVTTVVAPRESAGDATREPEARVSAESKPRSEPGESSAREDPITPRSGEERTDAAPRVVAIIERLVPAPGAPSHRAPDERPVEGGRPASVPRVEVTIGTIEVRAVAAPAQPPAPRSYREPPRPPSLEDYLRSRRNPRP